MYIQTNGDYKKNIQSIKKNIDKKIVLHYTCSNCNDEQVTEEVEFTSQELQDFKKEKYLYFRLPCMNCGYHQPAIPVKSIMGVETI